jgi:phenylalanyl-tRNA synthetase alpha chain
MTLETLQTQALAAIDQAQTAEQLDHLKTDYLGKKGRLNTLFKDLIKSAEDPKQLGQEFNKVKDTITAAIETQLETLKLRNFETNQWFDITQPGPELTTGHLHILTQTIREVTKIFQHIGFIRTRYPEIDTDWYAAAGLNIPPNHPARDEQETFYIKTADSRQPTTDNLFSPIGLTPHTSNGQLREMERTKKLTADFIPIRMINIGKCYRRQVDASHTAMFHQFEGLVVDQHIAITHLKGTIEYFAHQFFGPHSTSRLRPYNFRFTEPSFEVDFTCSSCQGQGCQLCKQGWLEVGGAGMVHPTVLKNGGIDPNKYSGFAFGWGIERVAAIKHQLPDIRLLYSNDIRFLHQF